MRYLITSILIINSLLSYCQIFDNEQANPKVKWMQINTEKFRLIFPEKFSPTAPRVANNLENQLIEASYDLNRKTKKIDVILQENNLDQNGFVQLAPRKSELYSTPSGIPSNQTWLTNLSLHEMRHVAQFDNLTGKIKKPYGQQLALALFALNLPSWYFEGDAVLQETLFSNGGRGRLPSWQMPIRANIQSNLNYNFNKYVHGSYKDLVPSYYTIGYFMSSELYQKNNEINRQVFEEMNGKLLRIFNFKRTIKKFHGSTPSQLFDQTMLNLKMNWEVKPENIYPNRILLNDKYPTDYILPQVQNGEIFAIQKGPQHVNRIVTINKNNPTNSREIIKVGAQIMPYFDIKKHLIVWDEYRRNPRYSKETFNVINIYNLETKTKNTIPHNTRYYTPTLSPDLQNIACIEVDESNNSYLILLDLLTKKKIKSIEIPHEIHIQQPQFDPTGLKIVAIGVNEKGTNLLEIDLKTEQITELLSWGNQQIERPIYHKNDIIYKSNAGQKDDIFILKNGKTKRITNVEFGAFNPFLHNDTLYFNDYTTKGLKINFINFRDSEFEKTNNKPIQTLYSSQNNFKTNDNFPTVTGKDSIYKIEKYNALAHTINFHSISLSGNDFENFDNLKPGIFILSNDVLNTTQVKLGFEYDTNIKKTTYSASISYQKYYPKITLGYQNKGLIGRAAVSNNKDSILQFDYRENLFTADIQIPFVYYRGNDILNYGVNLGTSYQHRYDMTLPLKNFNTDIAFPLNYQIYFHKNARRSRMDIFPKWGQNISFVYRHLPFEKQIQGTSWALRTSFYFPGIVTNHGIQLRYSMQHNTGRFQSTYSIPLINGIAYIPYKTIKNTLLIDYRLPLAYPDWSLGQIAYLKRIYAGLAANYLNIQETKIKPQSVTASLFFDFNAFKYTLPNFLFESRVSFLTPQNARKRVFPEFSLSYNY